MIDLMKIHPMTSLLGGTGSSLSNLVHCSDEMAIACHGYFTNEGKLPIEDYYQAVEKLKKKLYGKVA